MEKVAFDFKNNLSIPKKTILTLGCFDGIHRGHQEIIKDIQSKAQQNKLKSCLCLFDPHPSQILNPEQEFKRLFLIEEIESLLKSYNLDYFCTIPFDLAFSKLPPKDFIDSFIKKYFDPFEIVVGYDFLFGFKREGTVSYLKEQGMKLGFKVNQVSAVSYEGDTVSSSVIKKYLSLGDIEKVTNLLGHSFLLKSKVIRGEGRGHKLGFPTANLLIKPEKQLPKNGVYACTVRNLGGVDKKAVMNIGTRPSFSSKNEVSVEVHIINEDLDLYDKVLEVEISGFIREERSFQDLSQLSEQIQKDIKILFYKF